MLHGAIAADEEIASRPQEQQRREHGLQEPEGLITDNSSPGVMKGRKEMRAHLGHENGQREKGG